MTRYAYEKKVEEYVDLMELELAHAAAYTEAERGYTYATVADALHLPEVHVAEVSAELAEEELVHGVHEPHPVFAAELLEAVGC
ncbi:MAG: hypothetical protein CV089_02090 [Nitrospira sp. WS110]|nr:hypothetical protein [Nitrospira sp. WS110]